MADYGDLSDNELKKQIADSEASLRSMMSPEEYDAFMKKLDSEKIKLNEGNTYIPRKKFSFSDLEMALLNAPGFVVVLCKIINPILTLASTIFLIAGGLFSLLCAYSLYKVCVVSGWHGIFETRYALYIILFFVINFLVGRLRLIIYMIIN